MPVRTYAPGKTKTINGKKYHLYGTGATTKQADSIARSLRAQGYSVHVFKRTGGKVSIYTKQK